MQRVSDSMPMGERLKIFLDHWEASRHQMLTKWRLNLDRWSSVSPLLKDQAERKIAYYEHELLCLQELRARSLP